MDVIIYIAVAIAIIFRLVIMKGSFVLPTIYKNGNEVSFNLGSISTIIIGLVAAFSLMMAYPDQFATPLAAFFAAYSAPQIVDAVATYGVRNTMDVNDIDNEL